MLDLVIDDLAVTIRDQAVAVLIASETIAGDAVEAERVDPMEDGDAPRIVVFGDTSGETNSKGGTAPAFGITLTLAVDCFVQEAVKDDAVSNLDLLAWQVREALLTDPEWVKLSENIASLRVTKKFQGKGAMIVGEARILITCTWRETYRPRIHTPLVKLTFSPLKTTPPGATPLAPARSDGEPAFEVTLPTE